MSSMFSAFVKHAVEELASASIVPDDYRAVREEVVNRFPGLEKRAWTWQGFKEGLRDEGIPLAGATIGAGLGMATGLGGLTGGALGYAAGGGASLLRSKLRGEEVSPEQKILAMSALGYGIGGLTHAGIHHFSTGQGRMGRLFGEHGEKMLEAAKKANPKQRFHGIGFKRGLIEEGLPALGAVGGTAIAMGSRKEQPQQPAPMMAQPVVQQPVQPQPRLVVPPQGY